MIAICMPCHGGLEAQIRTVSMGQHEPNRTIPAITQGLGSCSKSANPGDAAENLDEDMTSRVKRANDQGIR
ncbi:MAG: hypothetical protein RLZZ124_280 [Cyanobacteriota bacterium]|jgi:hypothetical protein